MTTEVALPAVATLREANPRVDVATALVATRRSRLLIAGSRRRSIECALPSNPVRDKRDGCLVVAEGSKGLHNEAEWQSSGVEKLRCGGDRREGSAQVPGKRVT